MLRRHSTNHTHIIVATSLSSIVPTLVRASAAPAAIVTAGRPSRTATTALTHVQVTAARRLGAVMPAFVAVLTCMFHDTVCPAFVLVSVVAFLVLLVSTVLSDHSTLLVVAASPWSIVPTVL